MNAECVLDAELLRKYSSEYNCTSYVQVVKLLLENGHHDHIIRECTCFHEFLILVCAGKCTLYHDDNIRNEYNILIDKLPEDLLYSVVHILSHEGCTKAIDGAFTPKDYEDLQLTNLHSKVIYLNVAKAMNNRIIVSAQEDVEKVYRPEIRLLATHKIEAKNICKKWENIR